MSSMPENTMFPHSSVLYVPISWWGNTDKIAMGHIYSETYVGNLVIE